MATVFEDACGVIDMDVLEPGTIINSERYTETTETSKQ